MATNRQWLSSLNNLACIYVVNKDLKIARQGQREDFVWVQIDNCVYFSVYISPNSGINHFNEVLDCISSTMHALECKRQIIAGDLNAKAEEWGNVHRNNRGTSLIEWMASENVTMMNDGIVPTFCRRGQLSYLDVTMCTDSIAGKIGQWQVLDDTESLSDHRLLYFEVEGRSAPEDSTPETKRWNINKLNRDKLVRHFNQESITVITPEDLMKSIKKACDMAMPTKKRQRRKPVYWWNSEVSEARRKCITARRKYTRRRKTDAGSITTCILHQEYADARKELENRIGRSKKEKWKQLCDELDNDIWGLGYRIVMKKIPNPKPAITPERKLEILDTLFPSHEITQWEDTILDENEIIPFTTDELAEIGINLKTKKAPGSDGIPSEVLKILIMENPETFLKVFNKCLERGIFPQVWKEGKVVLLKKPGKPEDQPSSYRPICLLSTTGKVLEQLITRRLNDFLENEAVLSPNQFGFRPRRSTTDAVSKVVEIARNELRKPSKRRKLCAIVTIDVRNAFNSAPWAKIVESLKNRNIPNYIVKIIQSYFKQRTIVIPEDNIERCMTAGVPQGSCIGPVLWNVMYNGVLEIDTPEGITLVAYADDLAILALAKEEDTLEHNINLTLEKISSWMRSSGLALAPEKTEAALLIGKKVCRPLHITLSGNTVNFQDDIKYLGVILDTKLNFNSHLQHMLKKVRTATGNLSRILPRQGGAGENKRRILQNVSNSLMLYAAPVWSYITDKKTYKQKLISEQRKMSIRVSRAHRTVATEAVMVVSRTIPIDLIIKERKECYGISKEEQIRERERTMIKWQEQWDRVESGFKGWTKRLIPLIKPWYDRKRGEVNQYITQVLTGQGNFNYYLFKIKKISSPKCNYCNEEDTAEHTIFGCQRWAYIRQEAYEDMRIHISPENLIETMLNSEENWKKISCLLSKIMIEKETDVNQ
ncbi:hypothetical protein M8J77_023226 [Diaphorina citri]|nr:hypothetical protein M8J77_023226 [Diaphorina citri]